MTQQETPERLTREEKKARATVLEGYEEHHVADVLLDELLDVPPDTDVWKAKVKVLKENVEHHIKDEEEKLFPKAEKLLGPEKLGALGVKMADLKEAEQSVNFITLLKM